MMHYNTNVPLNLEVYRHKLSSYSTITTNVNVVKSLNDNTLYPMVKCNIWFGIIIPNDCTRI
jgi:hypothetical protein